MKPQLANIPSPSSCHHVYPAGRRCRFPALPDAMFCIRHVHSGFGSVPEVDLSRHFGPDPVNFKSAYEVNDFLCSLAKLMIENRISARRASVLAYIASLELRTLPAIDQEFAPDENLPLMVFDRPESLPPQAPHPATSNTAEFTEHTDASR
ncbi:MAG TPA: hypothetical protein VGJ06_04025 [Candidatus Acidoferrum sp.]|jgi:hypothetical protein